MSGIVVGYTLRTSWKQVLYWGLGLGLLGFYIVFIASDNDIVQGYANLFESMPPALLEAFGASDVALFRTTEGWIVSIFVSESTIFLSVFAVMAGLNITANDERSGIMDVILSLPISRRVYLLERWIGYALIGLGIILVCSAITLAAVVAFTVDTQTAKIFASILNVYPGTLLVMTVTCLLATMMRRRAAAIGAAAAFVVVSYVFGVIGGAASGFLADLMRQLSFFSYAQGEEIVLGSHDPSSTLALLVVVVLGFGLSIRIFERRDIGL